MVSLPMELRQLEAETFEIHDVTQAELALSEEPAEGSCSSCCSCSTSSTCGCSTSCSSTSA